MNKPGEDDRLCDPTLGTLIDNFRNHGPSEFVVIDTTSKECKPTGYGDYHDTGEHTALPPMLVRKDFIAAIHIMCAGDKRASGGIVATISLKDQCKGRYLTRDQLTRLLEQL